MGLCKGATTKKIEHLESRLFEVENFIKDFVEPKPKAKAKAKGKGKYNLVEFIYG